MTYVDASVLLRIVLKEPEPVPSWKSLTPLSSEIIRVESLRAIDRARIRFRALDEETARHRGDVIAALASFSIVPVSGSILERAGDPFPTSLGTLDAIHLSTALQLRDEFPDMAFATHDQELALAARSMGFEVLGT